MSLIQTSTPLTAQQKTVNAIKNGITQVYNQMLTTHLNTYNLLWKNQFGLTPMQVAAELGTDAGKLFGIANTNIDTLTAVAALNGFPAPVLPGIPTGYTVTPNQDGSVVITKA